MGAILLAGDDARSRVGISGYLETRGHEVLHVNHFRLAAEGANLDEVDAIVLGFVQPVRSREFVRAIRARDGATPIVVLVESVAAWRVSQLESSGAQAVLARPFRLQALAELIDRLIAPSGASRECCN